MTKYSIGDADNGGADIVSYENSGGKSHKVSFSMKNWFFGKNPTENQIFDVLRIIHENIIHELRDVGISDRLADGCRDSLACLMKVPSGKLHCSIKLFKDRQKIYALARSTESDYRRIKRKGEDDFCFPMDNTAFAAIIGEGNLEKLGRFFAEWEAKYPYPFFIANDLDKRASEDFYRCSRINWRATYKSVAVFPIKTVVQQKNQEDTNVIGGFITFDSIDPNMFKKLPDAFDFCKQVGLYKPEVTKYPEMHLCGLIADSLYEYLLN